MGWTSPRTYVAGEIITASIANTHWRDNLRYLKGLDGVLTAESGLIIDNTGGDEYLKLPLLSTAECTTVLAAEGQVAHDEQTHRIKFHNGTAIKSIVSTADVDDTPANGADTDPISSNWAYDFQQELTTAGDMPYATAAGVWERVGIGTANQLLRTNAGANAPEWATISAPTVVRKTADETINNSAVQQNDDHLVLAVGANEVWDIFIRLRASWEAGAAQDLVYQFTIPVAGAFQWNSSGDVAVLAAAATGLSERTTGTSSITCAAGATRQSFVWGTYVGGANAGNLQLQWAQAAGEAKDTKMLTNSYIVATKIA